MPTIAHVSYQGLGIRPQPGSQATLWSGIRNVAIESMAVAAALSQEMSFLDHLEELRKRLLRALGFLAIAFFGCLIFWTDLLQIARTAIDANPAATLATFRPQDVFSLQLRVSFVAALFVAAPFILAQVWLFVSPALYPHERRYAIPFVLSCSVLFVAGGAFGQIVAFPMTFGFLFQTTVDAGLTPVFGAIEYFKLFFNIVVALGVGFQIPAVVFILSRIGLVDARFLWKHTRHALLAGMVLAALITPPDLGSMAAVVVPMVGLYLLSIGIAWLFVRERKQV